MTDKYMFGARSEKNLIGVNPDLIKVVRLALIISRVDFAVIEGVRDDRAAARDLCAGAH